MKYKLLLLSDATLNTFLDENFIMDEILFLNTLNTFTYFYIWGKILSYSPPYYDVMIIFASKQGQIFNTFTFLYLYTCFIFLQLGYFNTFVLRLPLVILQSFDNSIPTTVLAKVRHCRSKPPQKMNSRVTGGKRRFH